MPFAKVNAQVDFPAQERRILELWDRIQAFEKLRDKNKNGLRWSFLDGPITAIRKPETFLSRARV